MVAPHSDLSLTSLEDRLRRFAFASAAILLCACGEASAPDLGANTPQPSATTEAPPAPAAAVSAEAVEGWDNAATNLLGKPLPGVELSKPDGSKMQADELRGHWTVVALWSASRPDSVADVTY